jgi:adenine C2-methylase RlmN of 23S rRNA A2503 and tRNA A37
MQCNAKTQLKCVPRAVVVVQGMGEPLSNYDVVVSAVQLMTDPRVFGLSRRHVTVSTVGVIPKIKQMASDLKVKLPSNVGVV